LDSSSGKSWSNYKSNASRSYSMGSGTVTSNSSCKSRVTTARKTAVLVELVANAKAILVAATQRVAALTLEIAIAKPWATVGVAAMPGV